ncbi:MAG: MerR family transcriptional regulator, partial [Desulfamplus sp.]|nr:MerR family transcriptional regulator [Desulfamplus sp.]
METTYSIKDAAAITGVTEKQLRNWEVQSFITGIERLQSGSRALRRYTEEQIRKIKEIKKLIDMGFTVSAA